MLLIPAQIRGVSRDVPEAEQGAVPGTRVVTGFLGSLRRQCQRPKHRGGAPKGAINLSAPDGAPLPYGETEGTPKGGPAPVAPGGEALTGSKSRGEGAAGDRQTPVISGARSARIRATWRRYRAGAGGRSSGSGPRSSPSIGRSSRPCARPRTAR